MHETDGHNVQSLNRKVTKPPFVNLCLTWFKTMTCDFRKCSWGHSLLALSLKKIWRTRKCIVCKKGLANWETEVRANVEFCIMQLDIQIQDFNTMSELLPVHHPPTPMFIHFSYFFLHFLNLKHFFWFNFFILLFVAVVYSQPIK